MQLELVLPLRDHGDHAGVVGARTHFAEIHLIALDEQLDTENSLAAQVLGNGSGDVLRAAQGGLRHGMRLPTLDIVTIGLPVPDGRAEAGLDFAVVA
ncbi:Uncharacterised protein [Mycobacteroides abscessus]|nr:Uncharacterised protein [Mycobacteroides abscessus]SHR05707.1 Uncharacterised protein [Mycobacteroides abscessus subsp. abscessus]SKW35093.1 Uncharacterised protein [Mycobacteroides abscessus subsp. massiliense]SHT38157.1 Uncharacterised protein [Mycobacteroides abscessus subsp. abscessus]SHU22353.1 Uncharacterised protein [Mycobacteroides abscessus subsp. abscessus]